MKASAWHLGGRTAVLLFALGALFGFSSCVPRDAGYQDVRQVVSNRTGRDVRWNYIDGESVSAKTTRKLLKKPLTADSAEQIALLNNPELQAAFEDLGVARGELVQALRLPNPSAEAALRFEGESRPDVEISISEDLSELFFMPLRSGVARAQMDAAKTSVGLQAMDLAFRVRTAFYSYLADKQILELRSSVLRALDVAAQAAQRIHDAGNITDLDLANELALYEEARLGVSAAETAFNTSREQLNALLGLWGKAAVWSAEGRLSDPSGDVPHINQAESRALERSVDLLLVRHRFRAAARAANLAQAEGLLPELKAGVAIEREEGEWGYGPLAEIEVPLFYQGQGEIARAKAEMRRQQKVYAATAIRIRAAIRATLTRLIAVRDQALYFKTVLLPIRERIVNETQLQFNAMTVGVFQLLQAKRDQIETARSYVEALRQYWTARAELNQLMAGRLVRSDAGMGASADISSRVSGGSAGGH